MLIIHFQVVQITAQFTDLLLTVYHQKASKFSSFALLNYVLCEIVLGLFYSELEMIKVLIFVLYRNVL